MTRFLPAVAVLLSGCVYAAPPVPPRYTAPAEVVHIPPPIVLTPPYTPPPRAAVRRDPRVKYTTDPRCHYVRYDGSCMTNRWPSYRIPGK